MPNHEQTTAVSRLKVDRFAVVVVQLLSNVQLFETHGLYSTPDFPVPHYLLEFPKIHVHCISDAI